MSALMGWPRAMPSTSRSAASTSASPSPRRMAAAIVDVTRQKRNRNHSCLPCTRVTSRVGAARTTENEEGVHVLGVRHAGRGGRVLAVRDARLWLHDNDVAARLRQGGDGLDPGGVVDGDSGVANAAVAAHHGNHLAVCGRGRQLQLRAAPTQLDVRLAAAPGWGDLAHREVLPVSDREGAGAVDRGVPVHAGAEHVDVKLLFDEPHQLKARVRAVSEQNAQVDARLAQTLQQLLHRRPHWALPPQKHGHEQADPVNAHRVADRAGAATALSGVLQDVHGPARAEPKDLWVMEPARNTPRKRTNAGPTARGAQPLSGSASSAAAACPCSRTTSKRLPPSSRRSSRGPVAPEPPRRGLHPGQEALHLRRGHLVMVDDGRRLGRVRVRVLPLGARRSLGTAASHQPPRPTPPRCRRPWS
eukprot:IDg2399t1